MGTDAPRNLSGARITIMGLGRFGGGVGVTRWLADQGADLLVTDLDPAEKLADSIAQIQPLIDRGTVTLRLGEHNVSDFTQTDLVVANPAVPKPWENRFLRAASAAGVPITTEIRLLTERLPNRARTIGITGSAGKSTTTSMIAHALRALAPSPTQPSGTGVPPVSPASSHSSSSSSSSSSSFLPSPQPSSRTPHPAPRVFLGGNIGGSLLADLHRITADDWIVLELSSAMLHWLNANEGILGAPGFSPGIAVVTNVTPNHIDWHVDFAHYERSKQHILRHQQPGDAVVLHESLCDWPRALNVAAGARRAIEIIPDSAADEVGAIALPGRHNRLNAAMAARAVALCGYAESAALDAIRSFTGLAHRLQLVGIFDTSCGTATRGVRVYNDSKSTTPESAALAVAALDEEPSLGAKRVHLICGGYDKKVDLKLLCDAGARCAAVYTVGVTGPIIAAGVRAAGGTAHECETIAAATARAANEARDNEAILLSPGCASWDQFTNFEARGELFIREIERVLKPLST